MTDEQSPGRDQAEATSRPRGGPTPARSVTTQAPPASRTTGGSHLATDAAATATAGTPDGQGARSAGRPAVRTRLTDRIPKAPESVRELFSRRPTIGPGPAAQAVVTDISDLVKAEVALAKHELTQKATEKGMGAGLFAGAAIAGWLALQGLLITAGFALALVLPAWAAALIVSVVLLVVAGILALIGKKKFSTPLALETTKVNVQEDVAWAKAHLSGPAKT